MANMLLDWENIQKLQKDLKKKRMILPKDSNVNLIFKERYLKKNLDGSEETIEDRLAAIAVDIASNELNYFKGEESFKKVKQQAQDIYEIMRTQKFLFNTPTLINFGRYEIENDKVKQKKQLGAACFVLPVEDTFDSKDGTGMLDILKYQVLIQKAGGGTGFSFARVRPSGSIIGWDKKSGKPSINWNQETGISSGPLSFLKNFYDASTKAVKQGNTRRGANSGVQRIDHPDFIKHMYAKFGVNKDDLESKIVNFNLSMAITDKFMNAVMEDSYYELRNPHSKKNLIGAEVCTQKDFEKILGEARLNPNNPPILPGIYLHNNNQDIINSFTGEVIGHLNYDKKRTVKIKARKVFEDLAKLSYSNGEPGVIFIDKINEFNPTPKLGKIEGINPCGEQPLLPFEACNLGSINVSKFVKNIKSNPYFDFKEFKSVLDVAVRSLDNVIDRSDFPVKKIEDLVKKTRKIGLGLMGVADAMVLLNLKYNSEEGLEFAEELAKTLYDQSRKTSANLAKEKGVFPAFKNSIYDKNSKAHERMKDKVMKYDLEVRNATATTQAPTGTISRLCDCSSGIEPFFSIVYESKIMGKKLMDISYGFRETLKREKLYSNELIEAIKQNGGNLVVDKDTPEDVKKLIEKIPKEVRDNFVTSSKEGSLKPEDHIKIQSLFQKYNDSAISKTINLPSNSSIDNIIDVYINLWKSGCKGGTVYVDKSRDLQVLNTFGTPKKSLKDNENYKRPLAQKSITVELPIGNALKNIGEYDEESDVVFTTICYDQSSERFTSVFQNASWGTSFDLIDLVTYGKTWSKMIKQSGGKLETLEKILNELPRAHQEGIARTDGKQGTMIKNDTTQRAMLNTIYFMKYLTNQGTDFSEKGMNQKFNEYKENKISLREILKSKGNIVYEHKGNNLPKILPSEFVVKGVYLSGEEKYCPYCKIENPKIAFNEGCKEYLCCSKSKCD